MYDLDKDLYSSNSPEPKAVKASIEPTPSPDPHVCDLSANTDRSHIDVPSHQDTGRSDAALIGAPGAAKAVDQREHVALDSSSADMSMPPSTIEQEGHVSEASQASTASHNDLAALAASAFRTLDAQTTTAVNDASASARTSSAQAQAQDPDDDKTIVKAQDSAVRDDLEAAQLLSPDPIGASVAVGTELAPMQDQNPKAEERSSGMTLPSIQAQLGLNMVDLKQMADGAAVKPESGNSIQQHRLSFSSQSPPRLPPVFHTHGSSSAHVSPPPVSPIESFHRLGAPSPVRPVGSNSYYAGYASRPSISTDGVQYQSHSTSNGYSSSVPDTPGLDSSGFTPASLPIGIDRMSIDNMTNPQIGGFQCDYPGCSAQPFQTQYLLNSHANVHSSNRPHYCPVKGCPRSEGGKGFKRKNEMIRHGLVHESPGYVCPYCVDREHRYPRPDNLQRYDLPISM